MKRVMISAIVFISFFSSCNLISKSEKSISPSNSTGSISAKFNGSDWKGSWTTSLIANLGNIQVLTIVGQISEKNQEESVSIGISSFAGVGTYNYGGADDKVTFTIRNEGKNYMLKRLSIGGGGGSGTIKITEFEKANGILNPGKAVGEFSGTINEVSTNEVLNISNGKFTSIIVL